MADENEVNEVVQGDGYAVANVEALGEGPGFRKVRRELGVTAFGVNAIEIPEGFATGRHYHEEQEELYFVHRGRVRIRLNDDTEHLLGPGGLARVDAATVRQIENVGDEPVRAGRPPRLICTGASRSARPCWRAARSSRPTTIGTSAWTGSRCTRARTRSCARSAPPTTCTRTSAPAATRALRSGSPTWRCQAASGAFR